MRCGNDLMIQFIIPFAIIPSKTNFFLVFPLDGSCPRLTVEDHRFSDVLDRPLELTGVF